MSLRDVSNSLSVGAFTHYNIPYINTDTGINARIGANIRLLSTQCRLWYANLNSDAPSYIRVICAVFKGGSENFSEDTLIDNNGESEDWTSTPDIQKMYKPLNKRKFHVLHDEVVRLDPTGSDAATNFGIYKSRLVKVNTDVEYSVDISTATDLNKHQFPRITWFIGHENHLDSAEALALDIKGKIIQYWQDVI